MSDFREEAGRSEDPCVIFSNIAAAWIDCIARTLVASRAGRARFMARDYERREPTCQPAGLPLIEQRGYPGPGAATCGEPWRRVAFPL
jgi:hypothetical protein